jgi:porin
VFFSCLERLAFLAVSMALIALQATPGPAAVAGDSMERAGVESDQAQAQPTRVAESQQPDAKADVIRDGADQLNQQQREQRFEKEVLEDQRSPSFQSLFGIPLRGKDYKPSLQIRCDALRHLKTPSTYRRLDSYFRPEVVLPRAKESDFFKRDFMTGDWGKLRSNLYKSGIDIYGCLGFDNLNVLQGNLSSVPTVRTPAPNVTDQQNYVQLYGLDFYSELVRKEWKGGQLHFSFAWPESKPIWLFGNALTPIATQSVHGNFYYDVGTARDNNGTANSASAYQGFRVFEIWAQQRYGKKMQNFVRVGNIYPWINFNKSMLAAMFNFWTFDEPGSLGSNKFTGRGPIYPTAPLGVQWQQIINENMEFRAQVGAGYYDPSSGIDNRRGLTWFLNNNNGVEGVVELSFKGGTYSANKNDFGLPWLIHIGGQFHTGQLYSNYLDVNGNPFQWSGLERRSYNFNAGFYVTAESMLFREMGSYNQGLTAFIKTTQYFHDYANILRNTYVGGLGYEGLIPGRDTDVLMVGLGFLNMTEGAKAWNRLSVSCTATPSCNGIGQQYVLEIGYSAKLSTWMFIQPSLQYLVQPVGRTDLGNITSVTLSLGISF